MAKVKKTFQQMTNGEKFRYYRKRKIAATVGKWGCVIAPFGIVFGVKFNEYVKILDTAETVKLSIGCVLALVIASIAVYQEIKHTEETKHIAPAIGWGVAFAFAFLFQAIMDDLVLIIGSEFAGQLAAAGLNTYAKHATEEMKEYKTLARQDNTLNISRTVKVKVVK